MSISQKLFNFVNTGYRIRPSECRIAAELSLRAAVGSSKWPKPKTIIFSIRDKYIFYSLLVINLKNKLAHFVEY